MNRVQIFGIVNLTHDSFSDGGQFLAPHAAIAQGERLLSEGAAGLDLGAESSNPAGQRVTAQTEIERLTPVVHHFKQMGATLSVDTYKPEVMRAMLALGVDMINDITSLKDPQAITVLRDYNVPIVLMFARNRAPRAEIKPQSHQDLIPTLLAFFQERLDTLTQQGIARERLILDPGMGYFLGSNPAPSLWVLKHMQQLHTLGQPLYLCTSRKSFIGTLLNESPNGRAMGTLATELWAMAQGVQYIRTHEVKALAQAWTIWQAITEVSD
ncbi:dihydropteroate synthase [Candidatus Cyanaurora vandensis]|uniref:dihydropteroate synthase n=1 Tax=Candidatus Cyanaurora vandensis TaxID=2714958 RepID=UPI00257BCBB1|nr:dihydropteroate synthase [Candidatus Cyanaurora vandensis]